jgi:hypothetical protein
MTQEFDSYDHLIDCDVSRPLSFDALVVMRADFVVVTRQRIDSVLEAAGKSRRDLVNAVRELCERRKRLSGGETAAIEAA